MGTTLLSLAPFSLLLTKVSIETIAANGYGLDIKNPHTPEEEHSYSSSEIVSMLHDSFRKSDELLEKLKKELGNV